MLLLQPRSVATINGQACELSCTMRVLYRVEQQLGFGLHEAHRRPPAFVGRALLWSMLVESQPAWTVHQVGAIASGEFTRGVEAAALLLRDASPLPDPDAPPVTGEPSPRTDWLELWAIGRQALRLGEAEFWSMAPVLYHALMTQWDEGKAHAEYCANIVAAMVANVNRVEGAEAVEPGLLTRGRIGRAAQQQYLKPAADLKHKLSMLASALPVQIIKGGA